MAIELVHVDASNVEKLGFFCYMSKRKSVGYQRKLAWLQARFAEGMRIKMLPLPERGFIEYIPGEYAWRAVEAKGYMFIHCLWVVGKSKGKGYGDVLIEECLRDAEQSGMKGVAMLTSSGNWLADKRIIAKHGFESVATGEPSFNLMAKRFSPRSRLPKFSGDWEEKQKRHAKGITVFRTDQCPYIEDAANTIVELSEAEGIPSKVVELDSAQKVREMSPSPYGVFNVVYNGRLLSYHYLLAKDFKRLIAEADS